jgi:hypothetical protein
MARKTRQPRATPQVGLAHVEGALDLAQRLLEDIRAVVVALQKAEGLKVPSPGTGCTRLQGRPCRTVRPLSLRAARLPGDPCNKPRASARISARTR